MEFVPRAVPSLALSERSGAHDVSLAVDGISTPVCNSGPKHESLEAPNPCMRGLASRSTGSPSSGLLLEESELLPTLLLEVVSAGWWWWPQV